MRGEPLRSLRNLVFNYRLHFGHKNSTFFTIPQIYVNFDCQKCDISLKR